MENITRSDLLNIRRNDPDSWEMTRPTVRDYENFERWVKFAYGENVWIAYNSNWDQQS